MPIVTLTTDFGLQDHYLALLKGSLLSQSPASVIVDITHNVKTYHIVQAAYILRHAYSSFPAGSIHIVSVDNYYAPKPTFLVLRHDGHYFIGPNNGIFSLAFPGSLDAIYQIKTQTAGQFPLAQTFAVTVSHILRELPFNEIGLPARQYETRLSLQPVIGLSQIRGTIIHIDNYGNAITNITQKLFNRVQQKRPFRLSFKRHEPLTALSQHYYDVAIGEPLCRFNSAGHLEIAINKGPAASLFSLAIDDTIQTDFYS